MKIVETNKHIGSLPEVARFYLSKEPIAAITWRHMDLMEPNRMIEIFTICYSNAEPTLKDKIKAAIAELKIRL